MENIFKNKLINYEETPPDFILENLKNNISRSNSNFIIRNKYFTAALVMLVAVVSSFLLFNNNTNENKQYIINKTNNITIIKKQQIKAITNNTIVKGKANIKTKKETIVTKNNTTKKINNQKGKTQTSDPIIKKISAGKDVVVCGNTFKMSPTNTKNGVWIADANIIIKDKTDPNTTIISKKEGSVHLIWKERIDKNYILDTVKITFINHPKSEIEIEKTNEICANNNAKINFITNNEYNYYWNDGFKSKQNFRNNLSAGKYTITVSNETCSDIFNVNITNKSSINADFYHTELYSAVDIPFYFTNRTKIETNENIHVNYNWNFGDGSTSNEENPEHTYTKYGDYNIELIAKTDNGCKDSVKLKVTIAESEVKMPNIFTPNGDGKHDILILNPKPLTGYYARIFDRSGREIAHWTNVNKGWNGKLKSGDDAAVGVYYYIVSGIDADGKKFNYKSFVHLSR